MTNNTVPAWTFPSPASDIILSAANFHTQNSYNTSMTEYLRVSAQNLPETGFGTKPVYLKDTIELGQWDESNYVPWCLECWEPYLGTNGWDACDGFTRNSSITLARMSDEQDKQRLYVSESLPKEVSVAVCTFAKSDPQAEKKDEDLYSLTVAYPFINKEREDGSKHTFSQAAPAGRRDLAPSLRTGLRGESVLTSASQRPLEEKRGFGGGSFVGGPAAAGMRPGTIVAIVICGVIVVVVAIAVTVNEKCGSCTS
ncbi:hypothetical protein K504DRAFT_495543 [Pleomassaria siparia CBS 279.74]|uniref:Uncharacterized protein n=1 Tax=Pleomassaria siparia CBS 279.74 TaxID=1314801 RepID=A0A6G1JS22_9PLEO|nr:hypothetical protein K504DRAFT_495543 [Pleomassaria siparia CBS 279.74]